MCIPGTQICSGTTIFQPTSPCLRGHPPTSSSAVVEGVCTHVIPRLLHWGQCKVGKSIQNSPTVATKQDVEQNLCDTRISRATTPPPPPRINIHILLLENPIRYQLNVINTQQPRAQFWRGLQTRGTAEGSSSVDLKVHRIAPPRPPPPK